MNFGVKVCVVTQREANLLLTSEEFTSCMAEKLCRGSYAVTAVGLAAYGAAWVQTCTSVVPASHSVTLLPAVP